MGLAFIFGVRALLVFSSTFGVSGMSSSEDNTGVSGIVGVGIRGGVCSLFSFCGLGFKKIAKEAK